jgi:hypothetical protein
MNDVNEIEFEEIDSPYLYTSHNQLTLSIFHILISKISKYPKLYFIDINSSIPRSISEKHTDQEGQTGMTGYK